MTAGIAVSDTDDLCIAGDGKMKQIAGIGHFPALPVNDADIDTRSASATIPKQAKA